MSSYRAAVALTRFKCAFVLYCMCSNILSDNAIWITQVIENYTAYTENGGELLTKFNAMCEK